ncbi:MAG: TetR family transcriptional regulator [Pseudomonadota bacterium]
MKSSPSSITEPSTAASERPRSAGVGRPRKSAEHADTAVRILDAAELLFSLHGFHGVTVRAVAAQAQVDAALAHYYFNTKQGLFDAVFSRRADLINTERMEAMNQYEQEHGDRMTVKGVVTAFLMPLLDRERHSDRGWKNYFALGALVNNSRDWGTVTMTRHFDPVVLRLIDLLQRILPGARRADLFWSYHFLTGSLTLTLSDTGRLDHLSDGLCRSSDIAAIAPRLIDYCAAGFEAVCLGK